MSRVGRARTCKNRAGGPWLVPWQDRPWGRVGGGCHPNRDAVTVAGAEAFDVRSLERFGFAAMTKILHSRVVGFAKAR